MTIRSRYLPLALALLVGLCIGVAASFLTGVPARAATDDAKAVVTQAIHLTDDQGRIRAVISLGKDGTPEVGILEKDGRTKRTEKLLSPKPMRVIGELITPKKGVAIDGRDTDCLVLHPRIGFAGGTGD